MELLENVLILVKLYGLYNLTDHSVSMDSKTTILEAALKFYTFKPPHAVTMDEVPEGEGTLEGMVRESLKVARENPELTMLRYCVLEEELFSGKHGIYQNTLQRSAQVYHENFREYGCERPRESAVVSMEMFDGVYVYSLFVPNLNLDGIGDVILEFVGGRCGR